MCPAPHAACLQEDAAQAEVAAEAAGICGQLEAALEGWELRQLLGGPYDARGAVLSIQARCRAAPPRRAAPAAPVPCRAARAATRAISPPVP